MRCCATALDSCREVGDLQTQAALLTLLGHLDLDAGRLTDAAAHLQPADVMVDAMRGRFTAWYRIRVNLRNVPEDRRPAQEALEVDYDPWEGFDPAGWERQQKRS